MSRVYESTMHPGVAKVPSYHQWLWRCCAPPTRSPDHLGNLRVSGDGVKISFDWIRLDKNITWQIRSPLP
jgi:hypothetical protein